MKKQAKRFRKPNRLSGALIQIYHHTGLSVFEPSQRVVVATYQAKMTQALDLCRVVANGEAQEVYLAGRTTADEIRARAKTALPGKSFLLIGWVLRDIRQSKELRSLILYDLSETISISEARWKYALRHAPYTAMASVVPSGKDGDRARVLGLFVVTVNEDGGLDVRRAGLLCTTRAWVPVSSGLELAMAEYLTASRRRFEKPLFLKPGEQFVHDFVLLDTGRPFPIEVNGRSDPDYVEHKSAVEAFLALNYPGHHLSWWPAQDEPIPKLPTPSCV
jgi:hypothetical protein